MIKSVRVDVRGDWGGEPTRAQDVAFSARVEAVASEDEIRELVAQTDRIAEVHNSFRLGAEVTLTKTEAVAV